MDKSLKPHGLFLSSVKQTNGISYNDFLNYLVSYKYIWLSLINPQLNTTFKLMIHLNEKPE